MSRLEQQHGDDWQRREAQRRAARGVAKAALETPTFSECVIGYRLWRVDPWLRLWPVTGYGEAPWTPGVNQATCHRNHDLELWADPFGKRPPREHVAPHQDCGCGLYSRRRAIEVLSLIEWPPFENACNPVLAGAIAVWGDLFVHHDGFRASHACIVALATAPDMPPEAVDLAERVAARYGVPLVAPDQLEAEASRSGTPLPDDVRPPKAQSLAAGQFASGGVIPGGLWAVHSNARSSPAPAPQRRTPSGKRVLAQFAVIGAGEACWWVTVYVGLALRGWPSFITLFLGYLGVVIAAGRCGPAGSRWRRREGTAAS